MTSKTAGLLLFMAGLVMTVAGLVTTVIYVLQPWRTCPYDDTPAACAMLPGDSAILMVAIAATIAGVCVVVLGGSLRFSPQPPSVQADRTA